jgi:Flp pilus assembly CpaE family ATPase
MLRGVIICPDQELSANLKDALTETHRVGIVRSLDRYPAEVDVVRFLRATAPEVVFLSVESIKSALELAASIEAQAPGTQIVAVNRASAPDTLLETMRAGIREFLAPPFEAQAVQQAIQRIEQILERKPAAIESTDSVLAFLPSKAGVGCSTVALNTSMMLSKLPETKTLLADFDLNCGMIDFMLQMDSPYSITSAVENAHQMDENLWQKMVTSFGQLDVLTAGKRTPGFRIDALQIRYLLDFARRNYKAICLDLSGILEKFSVEILHEAKMIFLVCTPEVPSLHLAREKLRFLRGLDLHSRVKILLNRAQQRTLIPIGEVEKLLGLPVFMSFPNDYIGVHKALTSGKHVSSASELGKGFRALAESIRGIKPPAEPSKPGFMEMLRSRKKPEPAASEDSVLAS